LELKISVPCCRSYLSWSVAVRDGSRTFNVSAVDSWDPGRNTGFSYACDCPDFRAGEPCVHVLYAAGHHCGWHRSFDQEEMVDPSKCPRCGGPVGTTHIP
jgi:hypothetical protein